MSSYLAWTLPLLPLFVVVHALVPQHYAVIAALIVAANLLGFLEARHAKWPRAAGARRGTSASGGVS